MPSDERDRQFERALQRHLRGNSRDAACPDAETLAAYHERTLSLEELARWKEHIRECARCQETLALVEETNSVVMKEEEEIPRFTELQRIGSAADVPEAFRKMRGKFVDDATAGTIMKAGATPAQTGRRAVGGSTWKWIAPVGALAAGLLIFVVVRENRNPVATLQPAVQVTENRETSPQLAKDQAAPQDLKREEQAAPKQVLPENEVPAAAQRPSRSPGLAGPRIAQNQQLSQAYDYSGGAMEGDKAAKDDGALLKQGVRPRSPEETRVQEQLRADLEEGRAKNAPIASAPMAAPRPTAPAKSVVGLVAGGAGEAKKESVVEANKAKGAATSTETVPAPAEGPGFQMERSSLNEKLLRDISANDKHFVLAPDGMYGWHVGAAGSIQATSDGGKTWKKQASGVTNDLSSGSAPAIDVCWIVGKAGTVLLTTDGGKRWTKISSPLREDAGGVHAADAQHATIWDVPNRNSFQTTDGGVTWTPAANE